MKKTLKYLFVFLLAIISIVFLFYFLYKNAVISNLTEKEDMINKKWIELFDKSSNRMDILKNFKADNDSFLTLDTAMKLNYKNRSIYKTQNSLEFVKLEFDVNQAFVKLINKYNVEESRILDELTSNGYELNKIVKDYNELVRDYNKYLSVFPNFIFAKKTDFKKKKKFNMQYGKENEDPIIKSKEIPEWAKDTL